jgi:phospholipid/cholesterol/gamma-HCH transport system substrate-binding protein
MTTESKGADFFVGLFLLIGLGIIAIMVLVFGRVGQSGRSYPLSVEFPNANGIVKGSYVLLSGARVGDVSAAPRLIDDKYTVVVDLKITDGIQIPRTAVFQIRSSGMLGDSYVDIVPPASFTPADFATTGETIKGQRAAGLDELTAKGGEMMDTLNTEILRKVSAELDEIKIATTNINTQLLSEKNLKNLEEAFANLKESTGSFADTSKKLDAVVTKVEDVAKLAEGTMKGADSAMKDVKLTLADFRKTADASTKTIGSARLLIDKAMNGEGPLGMLISDKQAADDLKSLVSNMRRSGVLFYKDRAVAPAATPAPKRQR